MKPRILIVDDYIQHAENLKEILLVNNYRSDAVYSAEEASELLKTKAFDLILLDNKLPGMDGLDFVREMRKEENDTPVIMYSAFGDSHLGSEAAKLGVYDFLPKGEDLNHLYDVIEETIQKYKLLTQQKFDAQYFKQKYNFVGVSPAIKKIFETIENIASTDAKILIIGETGSGKNLLAEAIHQISDRASKPYVWLDCNTIPENLLESELFGHERGAFTGAHRKRIGKLSVADKGTLFLDQIDDLSQQLQAKFLRLIETGKFEAVGSNLKQEIDIRVIAASISNLQNRVKLKKFREDLYYRLAQVEIFIPPLRERKEDIIYLVNHFIRKFCLKYKKPTMELAEGVVSFLIEYPWPGNVRELQFFVERLVILKKSNLILKKDVEILKQEKFESCLTNRLTSLKEAKSVFERSYIIRALVENDWNVNETASSLGIDRTNLYKKIQLHGIEVKTHGF